MNCMKCGREIEEGSVFCPECLEEMDKYPVKPGTAVLLPQKKSVSPVKKVYSRLRHSFTPEEMVVRLKRRCRRLFLLWLITALLLGLLAYPTVLDLLSKEDLLPGQNYSPMTITTEETNEN